jgi:hypothetical protein
MTLCSGIKLSKCEAAHSCLTSILGQGLNFKWVRLSGLIYHFSTYLYVYVLFILCNLIVAYQLQMLYTLKKNRKSNINVEMYRYGRRFLWINYSRIRLVRMRKPMKFINPTPSRNYNKYFTNIILCYMTTLFNFCGLEFCTTPVEERHFYIFQYVQPNSEAHSTFHLMGTRDSFFRKKRSECEADHSTPFSTEVKN